VVEPTVDLKRFDPLAENAKDGLTKKQGQQKILELTAKLEIEDPDERSCKQACSGVHQG
jgi:hypothetical protein